MITFESGGKKITCQEFFPQGAGPFPALIVVHGSGGPRTAVERYTPLLTRAGYAVFVVNYFERTGTSFATPALIEQHFPVWLETLAEAVTAIEARPQVDAARIGLLGVSLGAYLSLALASYDHRIAAVVDLFGGIPDYFVDKARRLPPVLILHGKNDPLVPAREALKLGALLQRMGSPYETKIYSGQGHGLRGAAWDAGRRIFRFLETKLKGAKQPRDLSAKTVEAAISPHPGTRKDGAFWEPRIQ